MENMAWEINCSFRSYRSKNILKTIKNRGRCVKMRTSFFYARSPDFHKLGLCYFLKILYL